MNEYVASGILHPVVCLFFGVFMCAKIRLFVYSVIRDGRVPSLLPTVSWRYLGKACKPALLSARRSVLFVHKKNSSIPGSQSTVERKQDESSEVRKNGTLRFTKHGLQTTD
jgi:hypothetical protein